MNVRRGCAESATCIVGVMQITGMLTTEVKMVMGMWRTCGSCNSVSGVHERDSANVLHSLSYN